MREVPLGEGPDSGSAPAPVHLPQHALTRGLRAAVAAHELIRLVPLSRVDTLEQDASGVTVHTKDPDATWWRGSYLVGCDGARSTVRKLLDVRFPGRTAVERHAVAALRVELPWPGQAVLHRQPPWRSVGSEVTARPLPGGVWRLDWLLPAQGELVTPEALIARTRETLAGWCGETPPYELLDTGVHTVHHRLALRWRVERAFLAGDAAHLLGALGTQGVDEGLRDAENLAWKLAQAWHHGASELLLDSYQAERRAAVAARLRAADQSLPILRGGGGLRTLVAGGARGHDTLFFDAHLGYGPLGAPPSYTHSPSHHSTPRRTSRSVRPRCAGRRGASNRSGRNIRTTAGPAGTGPVPRGAGRPGHGRLGPTALDDGGCDATPRGSRARPSGGERTPRHGELSRGGGPRGSADPAGRTSGGLVRRGAAGGTLRRGGRRTGRSARHARRFPGGRRLAPARLHALREGRHTQLTRVNTRGVLQNMTDDTCVRLWRRVHMDLVRYAGCVCRPSC